MLIIMMIIIIITMMMIMIIRGRWKVVVVEEEEEEEEEEEGSGGGEEKDHDDEITMNTFTEKKRMQMKIKYVFKPSGNCTLQAMSLDMLFFDEIVWSREYCSTFVQICRRKPCEALECPGEDLAYAELITPTGATCCSLVILKIREATLTIWLTLCYVSLSISHSSVNWSISHFAAKLHQQGTYSTDAISQMLQCLHLIPALNAWATRAKYTTVRIIANILSGHGWHNN